VSLKTLKNLLICFSITAALTVAGCSKQAAKSNSKDQTLRMNFFATAISLHPHLVKVVAGATASKALYEGLTRINLDKQIELAAAEKVDISPCKKIYTFTLRDAYWSNGEKVTSYHFADTWKMALDPEIGRCFHTNKFIIIKNAKKVSKGELPVSKLGIHAPDEKTFIVELEHPVPYFLELVADIPFSPVFDANYDEQTVFNGPFIIKSYEAEKFLSLVPNKFYWDRNSVKLDEIQISFIKDEQTAFSLYENGDFDWVGSPYSDIPKEELEKISNIQNYYTTSPFWIFLNTKDPMLKSIKIRRALSYAVDRSEVVKGISLFQKELYSIIPNEISNLEESYYIDNFTVENAKKLFNEGLNELGIKKEDFTFTLSHSNYPEHESIAVYLKHRWEKVFGIKIPLRKYEWSSFISKARNCDLSAFGFYLCNIIDDPSYLLEQFADGGGYYSTWSNDAFKAMIEKSKNALNEIDRKACLREAEKILMDEMPICPIYVINNVFTCKKELKNFYPPRKNSSDFKWAYFDYNDQK